MTPAEFFSFAGTVTFVILISAVIALFIYEHYAAKKK
jgi:Tfp pilus assembly major pilin PilA